MVVTLNDYVIVDSIDSTGMTVVCINSKYINDLKVNHKPLDIIDMSSYDKIGCDKVILSMESGKLNGKTLILPNNFLTLKTFVRRLRPIPNIDNILVLYQYNENLPLTITYNSNVIITIKMKDESYHIKYLKRRFGDLTNKTIPYNNILEKLDRLGL